MRNCKYCQAELAENGSFCPVCGKNNDEIAEETMTVETAVEEAAPAEETAPVEEIAAEEVKKATPGKIAVGVVAVVVLIAVLIGLVTGGMGGSKAEEATVPSEEATVAATEETVPATIPADGNPDDETCKGSYTVTDEEVIAAMDTVVATAGEYELTNAQLQIYYWLNVQTFLQQYGSYAMYFGLDYTQPLDTQVCGIMEGVTWQQFFLASAIDAWQNNCAMAAEARLAGFQVKEETRNYLDTLEENMDSNAQAYGFADAKEMMIYNVGTGAEIKDYVDYMTDYYEGYEYYASLCKDLDTSDAALEAYYQEHEEEIAQNGITKEDKYVDVRHILIMPELDTTDDAGNADASEASWAAAEMKAQDILNQYLAGDLTGESFGELANTYTADGNDVNGDGIADGGLYTDVYKGQMVPEFEAWCFDDARAVGDTGLVKTTYGWHVMYFAGSRPVWKEYVTEQLTAELSNQLLEQIVANYPLTVDYASIKLGFVNMGA